MTSALSCLPLKRIIFLFHYIFRNTKPNRLTESSWKDTLCNSRTSSHYDRPPRCSTLPVHQPAAPELRPTRCVHSSSEPSAGSW